MTKQDLLNSMLDKSIKAAKKPMWRKNLETIIFIAIFFIGLPFWAIILYTKGNYIIATLIVLVVLISVLLGFGGKMILNNMMKHLYK